MKKKLRLRQVIAMLLTIVMLFNTVTMDIFATGTNDAETIKVIEDVAAAVDDDTGDGGGASESGDGASDGNGAAAESGSDASGDSGDALGTLAASGILNASGDASLNSQGAAPAIIGEDTSKRASNIKYFLNEDFSYTAAIYPTAVHYRENGQWKDIDNTLLSVSLDGDNTYVQNKANGMKVSFAKDTAKDRLVHIAVDGYQLWWGMDTGNRVSARQLGENTLDLMDKAMPLITEDEEIDVEGPPVDIEEPPVDVIDDSVIPEGTLDTQTDASTGDGAEGVSGSGALTETESESDGDDAQNISDTEAQEESVIVPESVAAGISSRIFLSNRSAVAGSVPDNSAETDPSLAPVDNEPVGEHTTATLITENPDAAALFEAGDTEGLKALEEASDVSAAALTIDPAFGVQKDMGILPSLQKSYTSMDDAGEETLDDGYYKDLIRANQSEVVLDQLESRVSYANIVSGVSLEYVLDGSRLKENIILATAASNQTFVYDCMTDGLTPVLSGNEILFKDSQGATILYIQAPFMYDASGIYSDAVALGLYESADGWQITITADQAWLEDEARTYPVVIDPVINTPQDQIEIKDTKVCSNYPNTNYRDFVVIATGYESVTGDSRSYMQFDLPEMDAADIVVDAQVVLVGYTQSGSKAQVDMHKVTESWDSGTITWNTKAAYDPAVADYQTYTDTLGATVSFSITDIVKGWYRGDPNYGVMIKDSAEEGCYREFLSSDCYSGYESMRPAIYITYINATGLESFWTYHSQSVGRAGTGHVNDYTGNMVFVHNTAATSGLRMPASLTHVYNSNDKDVNLGYGYGYRLNYHQYIEKKEIDSTEYYKYTDEDGTAHYFKYDSDKKQWLVDTGIDLELIIGTASDEKYTVQDKSDQKLIFNEAGYLVKVKDSNSNTLTITYADNKISKITDGAGKVLTLAYDTSGNLASVVSPDGTKTFFYTNGDLTTITDIDSKTVTFTYSSHLLTKAQNIDGYSMNYTYTSSVPAKVASVAEKSGSTAGQSITIAYDDNTTTFTDHLGRSEFYTFNNAGNTTTIYNDDGYAETAKYITAEGTNKNKVSKTSKLQYTVVQMLRNPDAASLTSWTGSGNSYTLNTSADNARIGTTSLKLTGTDTLTSSFSQTVSVAKGKTYTFSAYVKPDADALANSSAMVQIVDEVNDSYEIGQESRKLIPSEGDWYRMEVTTTVPTDYSRSAVEVCVAAVDAGTVYFDCMQMEEGDCASRYNLIENNDFSNGSTGYTFTGTDVFDQVVDLDSEGSQAPTVTVSSGYCTTSALNVRSGAGTGYSVVASLSLNTRVYILGSQTDSSGTVWYNVAWASGQRVYYGYASSAYINKDNDNVSTQMALINTTSLNVRAGAGTGYSAIGTVSKDTQVQILETITSTASQEWYMIHYTKSGSTYTGCVLAKYVLTAANVLDTGITPPQTHTNELDNHVLMLYGNPGGEKKVTQTVSVGGSKDDAYVVNLWGAGNPVKIKDSRTFGVEVVFVGSDGTKGKSQVSSFEENGDAWMFLNDVVIADIDYAKIEISYTYNYNDNVVYFDGLSLYKEEYGASYIYDENGNVTTAKDAAQKANQFEYDSNDNLTMFTDAKGSKFNYTYDTNHNVTAAVSAANMKYTFAYDTYGNATESRIVNASNAEEYIKTVAAYNLNGSLMTSLTDPLGNTISYSYDEATGRLLKATDARSNDTTYTYNTKGQVTGLSAALTDADGQALTAQAAYTYTNDYLTGITYHGQTYSFVYDGFGNKTAVKQGDTTLVSYTYGANNGNLLTETYGNGIGFVYAYDKYDRLTSVTYMPYSGDEGTLLYSYKYNKEGNLAILTEALDGRVYRYYYDLTDRLVKVVDNNGNFYTYYYDANDNLTKVEEGVNSEKYTTTYTYDADNRETQTAFNGETYTTTYDALGRITKRSFSTASAFDTTLTYNAGADGSQSTQLSKVTNGSAQISYTYDANGNITSITDGDGTTTYAYDALNQLVREDNHQTGETVIYLYDAYGNILTKKIYPKTDAQSVSGTPTDTVTYGYDTVWTDKMTSYDGTAITYDACGNPLSYRGKNLVWIKGNQLFDVSWDGNEYAYTYNHDGIRVGKLDYSTYAQTIYQLTDGLIAAEKRTDGSGAITAQLVYTYDSNDTIIAMRYNGVQYYYMKNGQGDIIGIVDDSGNVVVEYSYDSWGKVLSVTGNTTLGNANPFRYRGYYYDTETGFYYLGSRYYDPEVGRFINADTMIIGIGQSVYGYNLFTYCFNNPVNMDDQSGNWPKWVQKIGNGLRKAIRNVKQDMKNFNINNKSEKKVLESNYFSAYKGKLVLRTNLERSGSYGVLFISRDAQDRKAPEDEVRHEYGHTKQLDQLGLVKYTLCIGAPSLFEWGSDSEYYRRPWEITADIYGGVQSRSYPGYETAGYEYLENSKKWGPFVWSTID